ncbi:restriction endonuclease subunit S [Treponema sp. Marseille-Q4130]|uniref:restriction endonuclease subunit S n=1 Tax=Treponema sp. Marseille-Q4130 TaxID=2766702 RepID=UPI0016522649|nr:restriction endonuclease subunit S [Treponema sp. Marseille-Q4130]
MNTNALRQKILDIAIHGKLVKQDPADESATVLLEKIRVEKEKKIASGELKRGKNDSYIFFGDDNRHYEKFADGRVKDIEDKIPFDLPDGWAWCRLGEISKLISKGTTPKGGKSVYTISGVNYLRIENISNHGTIDLNNISHITEEDHLGYLKRSVLQENDFVISIAGTLGKTAIVRKQDLPLNTNQAVAFVRLKHFDVLNLQFLRIVIEVSTIKELLLKQTKVTSIPNLTLEIISNCLIPLPPLAEQKRIVAKIETIFAQIDLLEQNKADLQKAVKQVKSKILDLAMHGKLVPQDPADEPASVLLEKLRVEKEAKIAAGEIKRGKNDSYIYKSGTDNCYYQKYTDGCEADVSGKIPFDIPEDWTWCRLGEIATYIADGDWIESKDQSSFGIRLLQTGNIGFGYFKDKKENYHYISEETFKKLNCNEIYPGDILISRLPEPVGRACIVPNLSERLITAVDCTIIRLKEEIILKNYFIYYTQSLKYLELIKNNCMGTTRLRISRANLEKILVLLPPLAEQKRIVTRIEELFAQLDFITARLAD